MGGFARDRVVCGSTSAEKPPAVGCRVVGCAVALGEEVRLAAGGHPTEYDEQAVCPCC
jgi:hypothetical protein